MMHSTTPRGRAGIVLPHIIHPWWYGAHRAPGTMPHKHHNEEEGGIHREGNTNISTSRISHTGHYTNKTKLGNVRDRREQRKKNLERN